MLYYEYRQDSEKAIHHLKLAVREEPNPTALFNLAVIYDELKQSQEAKKCYSECLTQDPAHFQAKVNIAIILEKEGKVSEAFSFYAKAAE